MDDYVLPLPASCFSSVPPRPQQWTSSAWRWFQSGACQKKPVKAEYGFCWRHELLEEHIKFCNWHVYMNLKNSAVFIAVFQNLLIEQFKNPLILECTMTPC